jgi:hypothetical protein
MPDSLPTHGDGAKAWPGIADAAAFLAQQWPVFPCGVDKRPITAHGFYDASRDPAAVRAMFAQPGARLIGVPTGPASRLAVVDLDVKHGGGGLEWLAANQHRLPRTRQHGTRSGGRHLLFNYPAGRTIRNSASKVAPGVDVRGAGGYVIVPPSDGYTITDDAMPAEMPAWLLDLLDPPYQAPAPTPSLPRQPYTGDGTPYGRAALEREAANIRNAPDGGKHHALNKAAYSVAGLVAAGELPEGAALSELRAALADIQSRCEDYPAAQRTLREGFAAGMAAPRQVPERQVTLARAPFGIPSADSVPDGIDPETGEATPRPNLVVEQNQQVTPIRSPLWIDAGTWDAAAIPARPWSVPGYLMRGAVSVLSGQGAGGKSSLVVAWTIACATGQALGAFTPRKPMRCINYNVEDDREEQQRRYSAALMAVEANGAEVMPDIIRCGPHDVGTLFERDPATGRIAETNAMQALERLCMESEAEVLICDPLAELHNAEENDNTAMRSVIAAFRGLARRLDIAVMILHHDRKGNNAPGDMDRMRGASAITGAVRVMMTLTTMSVEEADKLGIAPEHRRRHFRIDGAKSNYAIAGEAEWFKLEGYQIGNGEHIAACLPWEPPSAFAGLSMAQCVAVLTAIGQGTNGIPYAAKKQAGDDWAGRLLMAEPYSKTEGQAASILGAWKQAGALIEGPEDSPRRGHKRQGYTVNHDMIQEMRRQSREGYAQ